MEECIPLDGGCNWTVSSGEWTSESLSTGEFPPLRLSGTLFYLYIQVAWEILGILSIFNLKFNFMCSRHIHRVSVKCSIVAAYYISWTFSSSYESHYFLLFLWIPSYTRSVTVLVILIHVIPWSVTVYQLWKLLSFCYYIVYSPYFIVINLFPQMCSIYNF